MPITSRTAARRRCGWSARRDANLFASISAGICALWGPLHGGANEACVAMLKQIRADGGNVKKYVDMAKDKDNNFRLMGFGHRVYKNFDPRATIIKAACDKLLAKRHINDPIFDIAKQLEEVALNDPYFIERKLYPNVDFYSGVSTARSAFPCRCSRCCSRWAGCPAGSPTGWRCTTPTQEDLPPAADLHGRQSARVCADRKAVTPVCHAHVKRLSQRRDKSVFCPGRS